MAHIETFDALAEFLLPKLLDRSEQGLVQQGFFNGGKPKREHWKKLINAVFYAPLMRIEMRDYLAKPPEMKYDYMWRYIAEMEFMHSYVEHFGHDSLPDRFNPDQNLSHLLMAQRVSHEQVMDNFAALERNPHFLVTIAHMQQFFIDYVEKLQPRLMDKVQPGSAEKERLRQIFDPLKRVVRGNQSLFAGVMMQQFMAIHQHLAIVEGREVGEMTLKDFLAFDRYVSSGKLFTQKGDVCPFSDAYRLGMQGKQQEEGGVLLNISGIQLWRLHQHVKPAADAMRSELREDVLRAGMAFSQKIGEREKKVAVCPHRPPPQSPDDVLVEALIQAIG
jgi:hypothetical protein